MTSKRPKSINPSRVQNYWYRQGVIKYFFVLFLLGFGFRIITINQLDVGPGNIQEKAGTLPVRLKEFSKIK